MRRNLRLDWRALALLGALLSIIIDWPGLVYAMPTILPPVAATAVVADASPIDTLNTIKNDKTVSFLNDQTADSHKRFATMTPSLKQDIEMKLTQQQQQQQQPPLQQIVQRITTATNEKLKQQINDKQNSIRKPQQINNEKQEQKKTKHEETKLKIATAIHKEVEEKEENSSVRPLLAAKYQLESLAKVTSLLKNTHTKNSTNTNTENNTFKSTTTDTDTDTNIDTAPITTTSSTLSSATTTTPPTTTESLVSIPSTLMPTIIVETEAQAPPQCNLNHNHNHQHHNQQQEQFETSFKFSSSHHLAILSRTERSIRSSSSSSLSPSALKSGGSTSSSNNVSSSSNRSSPRISGASSVVRRSSDMSVMKSKRLNNSRNLHQKNNLDRNERSTVSHLSGPSRKIQLYIKNRFIQLLPDGTVNGTQDEQCDYTILQRSTVEVGRIKIQGVATCLYLCMDPCGAVYGSKEFTDDCVFNESMEQHNYNTYSSTYNSNTRRKYYLALNRHGEPRKLQIPPSRSLGKLATYTNAIPETVPQERVEQLIAKNFGANRVKHGIRQLCDTGKPLIELIDSKNFKARPKCNPNNSNNNSNSKNTLSRNLDKDNSLVSHNHQQQQQQHQQHQQHRHHTNSNNNNSNSNGQVPVANDKNLNNLNTNSRSSSSSSSSKSETNRDNSGSPSSISISQNNGHISNSNLSNSRHTSSSSSSNSSDSLTSNNSSISLSSTPHNSLHRGGKKAGKKRKCRRFENEEQHNCTTPLNRPTSFTKRGNQLGPLRQQKCQNLLLQQQQAGVSEIVLPPMCTKKGGSKNKQQQANKRAQGKNSLGADGLGPNNRRGKKLNMNRAGNAGSRQAAKNQQQGTGASNNGTKKKQNKNSKKGGGNNNNNNNKKNKKANTNSSSSSTTEKTESTSTLKAKLWETTSLVPSTTLYDNYDPHGETTSDRGDREQRNVRYSNSMEEYMEQSSEDTSANEDPDDDDNDMENNDENNEDASYEDDSYISSSSHMPYAAAESSHTPLTAGADDFLYYDQLDFIPMGLWKFIAILWLLAWSHHLLS